MGMIFGSKAVRPYVGEPLPDRFVVYDEKDGSQVDRKPTEVEQLLSELLKEARQPLSQTKFHELCKMCGDSKQQKLDAAVKENNELRSLLLEAEIKYAKLHQGVSDASDQKEGCCKEGKDEKDQCGG